MSKPTLPRSVRVGHQDIKIRLASRKALVDAYGDYDAEKQRIRIGKWQKRQRMAETVLHELDHAMWPATRWMVGDVEENVVTSLSSMRAQVMADNEELYDWLRHALRKRRP
jgi:hypothetical protein